MDRRDATALDADVIGSQVEELLQTWPVENEPEPEEAPARRTPHERGRSARKMTVTWPSAAWRDAILAEAERWGVRPCDVLTYAFAYLMRDLELGGHERPQGEARFWQRAGEGLRLPWEPEDD